MALFETASVVISGDTTPHAKPHPEPLLEAARRLQLLPSQCIYVGDDERDIRAGKAAGMPTVAARYGYLGYGADACQLGCGRGGFFAPAALEIAGTALNSVFLGLHWFRRGFGRAAGHVEVLSPR